MILSSDIRKHFTGIECDQLRRLENKTNDNMSFGTTLDDLTTVASSYPSTRGEYIGETTLDRSHNWPVAIHPLEVST